STRATARSTSALTATSPLRRSGWPGASFAAASSTERAIVATWAPASMNRRTIASPMPRVPPVTKATRPASSMPFAAPSMPSSLPRALGVQALDVGLPVPQLAQDLVGLLPRHRRRAMHCGPARRQLGRKAEELHRPRHRVLHLVHQ